MPDGLEDRRLSGGLLADDDDLREVDDLANPAGAQAVANVLQGFRLCRVELVEDIGGEGHLHCGCWERTEE